MVHGNFRYTSEQQMRQTLALVGSHHNHICVALLGSAQNGTVFKKGGRSQNHIDVFQTGRFGKTIFLRFRRAVCRQIGRILE